MGTKLKKNNAADMGPKERIVKITRRLEQDQLGPKLKAKLLARLVILQKKVATAQQETAKGFGKQQPAFPKLTMRLANIEEKLRKEEDPVCRADLEKRKANVQILLAKKKEQQAAKQCKNMKQRLSNIKAKLEKVTNPAVRATLEARKAILQAKLANKDEDTSRGVVTSDEQMKDDAPKPEAEEKEIVPAEDQKMEEDSPKTNESFLSDADGNGEVADMLGETLDKCAEAIDAMVAEFDRTTLDEESVPEDSHNLAEDQEEEAALKLEVDKDLMAAFPVVTKRLVKITQKLKTAKNPHTRKSLLSRKAKVEAELARKQENRRKKLSETKKEDLCPGLDAEKEDEGVPTPEIDPALRIAFPKVTQRLINISRKLKTVSNEDERQNLLQRKAKVEAELAKKQERRAKSLAGKEDPPCVAAQQQKEGDAGVAEEEMKEGISKPEEQNEEEFSKIEIDEELIAAFPKVTKQLANIAQRLKKVKNPATRKTLLNRKANVEAELVRKQEILRQCLLETKKEAVCPGLDAGEEEEGISKPEVDPQLRIAFPKVTQRLINISKKLKTVSNESQRQKLLQQKAQVEAQLVWKKEQQLKNGSINKPQFPGINKKMAMIEAQLKSENDEAKCAELEKRKALLLVKLMEKREMMDASRLSRQVERTQELLEEASTPERRCSLESRLLHFQQRQEEASQSSRSCTATYTTLREKQKLKLVQMEKKARANKNEMALDRIALQQVYVGHYPDPQNYLPVFGGRKAIKKRGTLRAQALDLARSEQGVEWIAADMYERLPQEWSLDDEVAMFGNKQQQSPHKNKKAKKNAAKAEAEDGFVAVPAQEDVMSLDDISEKFLPEYWSGHESGVLEDGFEKVMLDANSAKAVEDEGWMEVDNKEAGLPAASKKSNKNNNKNKKPNKKDG